MEVPNDALKKSDDISLKELVLKLLSWCKYLLSKWLIICIMGLLGAGLGLVFSLFSKQKYIGALTFVVEDTKPGGLAAYAGLAGQFGIDLGGGGSGIFEGENIMGFLRSRFIVEKALLSSIEVNGKRMNLVTWYLQHTELGEKLQKDTVLRSITYPLGQDRKQFSLLQDSLLHIIQTRLITKELEIKKPDKKQSFIEVRATTENELFSKLFTERLVSEAADFYTYTKTKRSKVNVDKLQFLADSLQDLLNKKTYALAAVQDVNLNPVRQVSNVRGELVARDKVVLQTMYGEVIKNLELSKLTMAQETPIVQVIDAPILPLEKKRFGKLKGLVIGGLLGGFFIVFILVFRRIYQEMMAH
ncbi:lipopolysaccharide biosynthesis protein [Chitinophaga agri]|uniref:Lipopolysaccharide biosynthesis protein n=1 Tax=Chitinophaga agri TaxID=2703787 RepID=A0A6B9ZJ36_9BACT|nr:lipopolysaccharide biosynthesis protein [Chitinophaga agri]QHS61987.1 lipopolysaccharide biosynthesis protein [Chitinophaga agri]